MKITYTPNPLRTRVELDAHDKEVFRLKIRVAELDSLLFSTHCALDEEDLDLMRARSKTDPHYYMADDKEQTPLDKRVDMLFEHYVEALVDTHVGDCTCQPCSCMKCRAEDILGINTLELVPGKHVRLAIDSAFRKHDSLDEALVYLRDHKISREKPDNWSRSSQEEYARCIPRWEVDQARAYECLSNYAKEHFG